MTSHRVAVVIPCYRVKAHIAGVLAGLDPGISKIYVVDDCCPEQTGEYVAQNFSSDRIVVLRNPVNLGVGGATVTGYLRAVADGADIVVKMDGDGQMDGACVPKLVQPILMGLADYTKGNRFYDLNYLRPMPLVRLLGNCALSFLSKISGGYWNIMDPTNGFTAVHRSILIALDLDKVDKRYFFESDMLFRLYLLRAVVMDVPMPARYGQENSSLAISRIFFEFAYKHVLRFLARIFYSYFLRDFQIGSIMLVAGVFLSSFGVVFGSYAWHHGVKMQVPNYSGTVMLAALPCIIGLQLLLTFLNCDMNNVPSRIIHSMLPWDTPDITVADPRSLSALLPEPEKDRTPAPLAEGQAATSE